MGGRSGGGPARARAVRACVACARCVLRAYVHVRVACVRVRAPLVGARFVEARSSAPARRAARGATPPRDTESLHFRPDRAPGTRARSRVTRSRSPDRLVLQAIPKKMRPRIFPLDQTRLLSRFRLPDDERGSKNEANGPTGQFPRSCKPRRLVLSIFARSTTCFLLLGPGCGRQRTWWLAWCQRSSRSEESGLRAEKGEAKSAPPGLDTQRFRIKDSAPRETTALAVECGRVSRQGASKL